MAYPQFHLNRNKGLYIRLILPLVLSRFYRVSSMSKRKAPSSEDNPNHDFCEFLMELAENERNVNRNIHKYNAYRKAATSLAAHATRIKSGKEASKLEGVGQKIAQKIDEFLETGKLAKLEKIREDGVGPAISTLTRVSGIGPAKAKELYDLGIRTIEELKLHENKLNHHQRIGLKYFEDFEKRIPRDEIKQVEEIISSELTKLDKDFQITICGSYRRGKAESGDMDVLITHPNYTSDMPKSKSEALLKQVVSALQKIELITDTISVGDVKFMGACKPKDTARRLDIRVTPIDQYFCAVLYFTGSDMFNKQMRAHALQNNFTLNEYCLRPIGSTGVPGAPVPISSEKNIFEYIDFPYKLPEERN
nr:PREDICTED: DNA polymerase beta-like [Bemisia tabaci]